jgi:hypothetical protein
VNRPNDPGPLCIDPVQMRQFDELIQKYEQMGEKWFIVNVNTHEIGLTYVGSRKHRRAVYFSTQSMMKYSKFFFDRPSDKGFRKGLGITLASPT